MNKSQLEGSSEAAKWSICLNRILHCNGSLLAAWISLASELLLFIFQRSSCWKKKIYSIYIDKRIAIAHSKRHKLRSQFPYLLPKFGVVREFVSRNCSILLQQFHLTSATCCTCNLGSFEKPLLTVHMKGKKIYKKSSHERNELTSLTCFSSQFIHLILDFNLSNFIGTIFAIERFLKISEHIAAIC